MTPSSLTDPRIERGPTFLKFNRDLTRLEVASLCERLWNFRSTIPDPGDNHINFAIGDALNEFSRLFGEEDGEHFMKQWERFASVRDATLKITGGALIYLQQLLLSTRSRDVARCSISRV